MGPPYPVMLIARWFIAWAAAEDEEITNLKLQKLLYFAQGHHLARYGTPLFGAEIRAWAHGPAVPEVYHALASFGTGLISDSTDDFAWNQIDPETTEFLGQVWNTYGGYSAGRLREMTRTGPWRQAWRMDDPDGGVIEPGDMAAYFRRLPVAS
jgi:uncharacterized phage-associated protein